MVKYCMPINGRKRVIPQRKCLVCEKEFRPKNSSVVHCSKICSLKTIANKHAAKRLSRHCLVCGTSFARGKRGKKYCSRACLSKVRTKNHNRNCAQCGEVFSNLSARVRFCSSRCYWESGVGIRRGEQNHFWKGGITPINFQIRSCSKYRQWRCDVFERDDYTCQICQKRGGRLDADHIKQFARIIHENEIKTVDMALECEELWNINNGRTLCHDCHKETDTYLKGALNIKK